MPNPSDSAVRRDALHQPLWLWAPTALAVLTDDGRLEWNTACRTLLRDVVGGSELAWSRWLRAAVVRLCVAERTQEILAVAPDRDVSLEIHLAAVSARPGPPDGAIMAGGHVAALRVVETSATGTETLADTVSTLSHELRTPLASMKSSLKLVLDGETGPLVADQAHFLGMTLRNAVRLERLVGDLLDVSQAEAGCLAVRRRETDLVPVLRETVELLTAGTEAGSAHVDTGGLPDRFVAHVDGDKIVQMVNNVVGNALKYARPDGRVRIWLEADPRRNPGVARCLARVYDLPVSEFNIVVEDSGPGIAPEHLQRVCDAFVRANRENAGSVGGAGLGLFITRRLAEAQGGRLALASRPGEGTTVWLRLPRDGETESLLRAAGQLESTLGRMWVPPAGPQIAVLDLRQEGHAADALAGAAREFVAADLGCAAGGLVELAPGLLAAVVADAAIWHDTWRHYPGTNPVGRAGKRTRPVQWDLVGVASAEHARDVQIPVV